MRTTRGVRTHPFGQSPASSTAENTNDSGQRRYSIQKVDARACRQILALLELKATFPCASWSRRKSAVAAAQAVAKTCPCRRHLLIY